MIHRKWHKRLTRGLSMLVLSMGLVSCAFLKPPAKPPLIYDISAPADFSKRAHSKVQLLIKEPSALKFLDNERIVIRVNGDNIEYLPQATWSDKLPRMLQARLVESFENSNRAGAVAKPGEGLLIDYQLVTDVRAFEIVASPNGAFARVVLSVKLLNDANGRVLRSKIFTQSVAVGGVENTDYVAAIDNAFDTVARKLIVWAIR